MQNALKALDQGDSNKAMILFNEIFKGVSKGKKPDPGMAGSLLYHMAMTTKMETETRLLQNELPSKLSELDSELHLFFDEFVSDANELTLPIGLLRFNFEKNVRSESLTNDEKIDIFNKLSLKTQAAEKLVTNLSSEAPEILQQLFLDWAGTVREMRLRQEHETIKSLLVTSDLAKTYGINRLESAMIKAQLGDQPGHQVPASE